MATAVECSLDERDNTQYRSGEQTSQGTVGNLSSSTNLIAKSSMVGK